MKNKNNLAYLLLFLTTLFWSGNFIVGKAASFYEIPPFSLNFYRWLFAWLILFPFTFKELIKKKDYIFTNIGFFIICKYLIGEYKMLICVNTIPPLYACICVYGMGMP